MFINWRSPSLCVLTQIIFNMELTHLGSKASAWIIFSLCYTKHKLSSYWKPLMVINKCRISYDIFLLIFWYPYIKNTFFSTSFTASVNILVIEGMRNEVQSQIYMHILNNDFFLVLKNLIYFSVWQDRRVIKTPKLLLKRANKLDIYFQNNI